MEKDTEQNILSAARREFIQNGMKGARMQVIADSAGVNKALLHYYFRSKRQLFIRIVEVVFREIIQVIETENRKSHSFKLFLKNFIDSYSSFLVKNQNLTSFLLWELTNDPDLFQTLAKESRRRNGTTPYHIVEEKLKQGIKAGEIKRIHPVIFFINFISLMAFPQMLFPLINSLQEGPELSLAKFLTKRNKEVFRLLWKDLKNDTGGLA